RSGKYRHKLKFPVTSIKLVFPMKTRLLLLAVAMVLGCSTGLALAEAPPARSDKATSIFDGKTLEGWESPSPDLWAVKDGCLTGGNGKNIPYNDFLCTKASYSN